MKKMHKPLGDRLQDGPMREVPSDVMENPKLVGRAKKKGKVSRKGFTFKDAGDALAASRM